MIRSIRSDNKNFKTVNLTSGFNVILADRTQQSTDKDSRNGLGKSTLIEIIHFCLGSSVPPDEGVRSKELENWIFILDMTLGGNDLEVSRCGADPSNVWLDGAFSNWPIKPEFDREQNRYSMKVKDWCFVLGYFMFGISKEMSETEYAPTFRGLISYFARRGVEGYANPFKHFSQQKEWDKQVSNSFLLRLNWGYAGQFQVLKDKEKVLDNLKVASKTGLISGLIGSVGSMEAEEIALVEEIKEFEEQIKSFKVYPQYYEIQESADKLTGQIHALINQRTINASVLDQYKESIKDEIDVSREDISSIYKEAGLLFSQNVNKKIDDVLNFHKQIIKNRETYLKTEIEKISGSISEQEKKIESISNERGELLNILKNHGALDEYSRLQQRLTKQRQQLEDIKLKIENLKKFEQGIEDVANENKELLRKARQDKEERRPGIEEAIKFFNQNSKTLYDEPGVLSIDLTSTGYKFGVDIKRAKSQGIGYMKVFCYDLTLAQLGSGRLSDRPDFLIHDSTIFDGVDERQIAKAMELAASESSNRGFQYICTMNSDMIPYSDFSEGFKTKFDSSIRLRLTDSSEDGGLLGVRF